MHFDRAIPMEMLSTIFTTSVLIIVNFATSMHVQMAKDFLKYKSLQTAIILDCPEMREGEVFVF